MVFTLTFTNVPTHNITEDNLARNSNCFWTRNLLVTFQKMAPYPSKRLSHFPEKLFADLDDFIGGQIKEAILHVFLYPSR